MNDSSNPTSDDDSQRRIEAIAEEFLAALQAGERPDPADVLAEHPDLGEALKRRLALVERLFLAGQNAKAGDGGAMPAERAHRLKCPHCGNRIQLVEPRPKEITCVNCGSSFRVEPGTTATFRNAGPGGTIGRFEILELLGRGAFGEVYKARDPQLDRFVALKVPRADYFATSEDEQRFLREARSAAGLRHPSIVQVYEIAHERGSPYIVSDYIDGLTLADLISGGRPAFRESAELVAQLADALEYAHRQRVIHRDIKPSNILLATGGGMGGGSGRAGVGAALDTHYSPFLADFGLARRDEGEITVTLDGQVLGTPAYMAPEQAAGDHARVDGRSDVYSLGVVLYELLSGELPFRGSRRMLLHQVLNDEPRPPRTLNDQIPRDLETMCLKAMAKEPARRYLTAADFRDDLRRFLRGDPIAARRVARTERTWRWCCRNPLPAGLAAAVAATLLAGTVVSLHFAQRAVAKAADEESQRRRADGKAADEARQRQRADDKAADEARERKRADAKTEEARHNLYVAHMNLANHAYEGTQIGRVLQLLDLYRKPSASEPVLRGFEWYYLDRLCNADLCTLNLDPERKSPLWTSVAFDAECQRAAVVTGPGTIEVFDIRKGDITLSVTKAGASFSAVAISADGQRIAAIGDKNYRVTVWDTQAGGEIYTTAPIEAEGSHRTLLFSPDGRWIASADSSILQSGKHGEVFLWDGLTGKVGPTFRGEEIRLIIGDLHENVWANLRGVVFSPDGSLIAARSASLLAVWEVGTWKPTATIPCPTGSILTSCLAFSPDGQRLAAEGPEKTIGIWDATTGNNVLTIRGHTGDVTSVSFSPDGQRLASASHDSTVRIWDLASGRETLRLRGHASAVTDVAFAADGWRVASVDAEGTVKLWDSMTSHESYGLHGHIQRALCVAFSRDGHLVASGSWDRTVTIWDVEAKRIIQRFSGHPSSVQGIDFSSDGSRLVAASGETAKIWDVVNGKEVAKLATLGGRNESIERVVFSPDDLRLAGVESKDGVIGGTRGVYVWDVASRQLEWTVQSEPGEDHFPRCVAFSPDGQRLAYNFGSQLHVRDLDSHKEVLTLTGHSARIETIIYSPDGRHIVSGGNDGIRFWDAASGREIPKFRAFIGKADRLAFVADGQRLISGHDGSPKLWDTVTGQEVFSLNRGGEFAVTQDGTRIAVSSLKDGIELLEGSALSADAKTHLEATGLIEFLYATEKTKERVVTRLNTISTISDSVRHESLMLAQTWELSPLSRNQLAADHNANGQAAFNNKDFATAVRQFTEAVRLDPEDTVAYSSRGAARHALGELDMAIADCNEAIHLNANNVSAFFNRGFCWHAKGELEKALADFNEAIRLYPKNVSAFVSRGTTWYSKGDFEKARADFDEAIRLDPTNSAAYADRGNCRHAMGQLDEALADFNEAIRLDPKNVSALISRGAFWYAKGELDKALADYDEAIHLDPKNSITYAARGGNVWHAKGELEKAMADYNEAIRLDPTSASALSYLRINVPFNRGTIWNARGDLEKALVDYNDAIRLDPRNALVLLYRAAFWCIKGEPDKAIADYDEAIRLEPTNSSAYASRGSAWKAQGEYDKTLADYNEAIDLDAKSTAALSGRAWIRSTCSDEKYRDGAKAVEDATKAAELADWKDFNILDTLAAAYAESGHFDQALEWQEKAIGLAPEEQKEGLRSRLKLYQEGKPYRDEPKN